jgi:hypothetical protein
LRRDACPDVLRRLATTGNRAANRAAGVTAGRRPAAEVHGIAARLGIDWNGDAEPGGDRVCTIEDCGNPYKTRGWCGMHYSRWRKHGDPLWTALDMSERFWAKVDRNGPIHPRLGTRSRRRAWVR